ncbi:alpha-L-glutamate ligase [Priestia megaterium]|nr:alpha-L-glutamate ligase [Priestia megaterium]
MTGGFKLAAKIYVIHENAEWSAPLFNELDKLEVPYEDWFIEYGHIDLSSEPPEGIFYNRMSASSHTRNHRFSPEYTAAILSWLESHGRTVLNNSRALQLEVSKVAQYTSLQAHGIQTPKTIATIGKEEIIKAAQSFEGPFITKHNRAGKGLGVQLFQNIDALKDYVNSTLFDEPIDGITLLQQYIESPNQTITRCEFIGGQFFYAVDVDTSEGFQLCPADACQIGDAFCPTTAQPKPKFQIRKSFTHPVLDKYAQFLKTNGITFAGIEMIQDKSGQTYTYDINTNTNYNPDAEEAAQLFGMKKIANYLATELHSRFPYA